MGFGKLDETALLALAGLLISVLIAISVVFGLAWYNDLRHSETAVELQSCYNKTLPPP